MWSKSRYVPLSLTGLVVMSFALLVAWSLAVPIFEAPDEPDHWQYVLYVRQYGGLPLYGPDFIEANSPPVYYFAVAPFASESDLPERIGWLDAPGRFPSPAGSSLFRHTNSDLARYWPLRRVRLVTAFFSTCTVLLCYAAGREATTHHETGLLAAGLVAFLPLFTFRGMNISNDAMVTLFCAVVVCVIIRIIKRGFTWLSGLAAALAMGLAFLSKSSAIFLPISFLVAVLAGAIPWRARLTRALVLVVTLIVVAPWLARNQVLYGDPLASRVMLTAVGNLVTIRPITSAYFVTLFPIFLIHSFIGSFGWMNVWMPEWVYLLYGLLMAVSLVSFIVLWLRRRVDGRLALTLLSMPVLSLMVVIYINLSFSQPQGRYLLPALPAMAVIGALGLEQVRGWSRPVTLLVVGLLAALNGYVLVTTVIPEYWAAL